VDEEPRESDESEIWQTAEAREASGRCRDSGDDRLPRFVGTGSLNLDLSDEF